MDSQPFSYLSNYGRKRRRPALACDECRRRKIRCDRVSPCGPCIKSDNVCNYSHPNHERNRRRRAYLPATTLTPTTSSLQTSSLSSLPSLGPPAITPDSDFCEPFFDDLDLDLDAITNESSLLDHMHVSSNGMSGSEDDCSSFPVDILGQVELSSPSGPCSVQSSTRTGAPESAQHDRPAVTFTQVSSWRGSHWETAFDQVCKQKCWLMAYQLLSLTM